MIPQISSFIKEIPSKPTWGNKELITKLTAIDQSLSDSLKGDGKVIVTTAGKKAKVDVIKKYDILYVVLLGIPHYLLVYKVTEDTVYGLNFTSKERAHHTIHEIKNDRYFAGSFATNSYLGVSLDEAKDSFVRVFESKSEANLIFNKLKEHFRTSFNFK